MSLPVFKVEPGGLEGLGPGAVLTVTGPEARHAVTVRRLGPGEHLELVDGAGARATGELCAAGKDSMDVRLDAVSADPVRRPRLVLAQALAKGERDLLAVETATELGVDAVVPWQAERSIVRWKKERAAKSHDKWVHTVAAAAKQSRRAHWPEVLPLSTTRELAALLGQPGTAGVVLHEQARDSLADQLGRPHRPWDAAERIVLVVGPEGGIAPGELEALAGAGARTLRLGPEVLRSSTAGPVALAVLSAALGRWDGVPG
ncbi:16S rRNA (uracil(1498)-N(3))-methyltransferase [Kocuria sediminis]|uniref:Ribosomal RNA small subunit methyltransferase E n=1 Tax=Kocuria sediminis TaxID=1038857 RepID=A0A6N8GKD6_9MICC|nr:16S rRNA (uracil(1498)-N(3))-methyltransferase [Kocuria sediminis]